MNQRQQSIAKHHGVGVAGNRPVALGLGLDRADEDQCIVIGLEILRQRCGARFASAEESGAVILDLRPVTRGFV